MLRVLTAPTMPHMGCSFSGFSESGRDRRHGRTEYAFNIRRNMKQYAVDGMKR